ncbi:MAG TPA: quinone-dependent dihydroorotate dehydrogenase [Solirubrobacterales bacterium]|nr:quinone-dependent dihydroorotate dehydrogenase [Solirubrobacterales bacterium]
MIYRAFFRLVLRRIDAERAHSFAIRALRLLAAIPGALALIDWLLRPRDEGLRVHALGLDFRSPLGVAAGVDKDATAFEPLLALGYGAVEVGTVTAVGQPGNARPRATRLPRDRALLNAMGFPNEGAATVADRLARRRSAQVVGINVGKSKVVELDDAVADYRESVRRLAPYADYVVLNVSSPNTPGLREMQTVDRLSALINGVREELRSAGRPLPLLVKLAPDLPNREIEEIAGWALRTELDGIIAVNTTTDLSVAVASQTEIAAQTHGGGISGRPLQRRAVEVLRLLHTRTEGRLALISVGGVETAEDAWQRILGGATLVQAYTGFVYGGPLWPRRINRGLARLLRDSQWGSLAEAVGKGSSA